MINLPPGKWDHSEKTFLTMTLYPISHVPQVSYFQFTCSALCLYLTCHNSQNTCSASALKNLISSHFCSLELLHETIFVLKFSFTSSSWLYIAKFVSKGSFLIHVLLFVQYVTENVIQNVSHQKMRNCHQSCQMTTDGTAWIVCLLHCLLTTYKITLNSKMPCK